MRIEPKEKTARNTSVGADARQSIQKDSDNSIPASEAKRNREMDDLEEMYRRMQRMADPRYLHTLTMTELFQTSYKSRPPIIENLLHSGAYLLAGAPKIGKSFLVAQIAYHVSTGQELWGCKVHQGTVLYLALEDDFQRIQNLFREFLPAGKIDHPYRPAIDRICGKQDFKIFALAVSVHPAFRKIHTAVRFQIPSYRFQIHHPLSTAQRAAGE